MRLHLCVRDCDYACVWCCRRGAVVKASNISAIVLVNLLSGAGSSPAGSVGRDLNLQKLNYQYLPTSVAVVLVVRWYFNG